VSPAAALLELLPASARARLVAADLPPVAPDRHDRLGLGVDPVVAVSLLPRQLALQEIGLGPSVSDARDRDVPRSSRKVEAPVQEVLALRYPS
jgi:hypothetical protein